jgi:hypothetical protein
MGEIILYTRVTSDSMPELGASGSLSVRFLELVFVSI